MTTNSNGRAEAFKASSPPDGVIPAVVPLEPHIAQSNAMNRDRSAAITLMAVLHYGIGIEVTVRSIGVPGAHPSFFPAASSLQSDQERRPLPSQPTLDLVASTPSLRARSLDRKAFIEAIAQAPTDFLVGIATSYGTGDAWTASYWLTSVPTNSPVVLQFNWADQGITEYRVDLSREILDEASRNVIPLA